MYILKLQKILNIYFLVISTLLVGHFYTSISLAISYSSEDEDMAETYDKTLEFVDARAAEILHPKAKKPKTLSSLITSVAGDTASTTAFGGHLYFGKMSNGHYKYRLTAIDEEDRSKQFPMLKGNYNSDFYGNIDFSEHDSHLFNKTGTTKEPNEITPVILLLPQNNDSFLLRVELTEKFESRFNQSGYTDEASIDIFTQLPGRNPPAETSFFVKKFNRSRAARANILDRGPFLINSKVGKHSNDSYGFSPVAFNQDIEDFGVATLKQKIYDNPNNHILMAFHTQYGKAPKARKYSQTMRDSSMLDTIDHGGLDTIDGITHRSHMPDLVDCDHSASAGIHLSGAVSSKRVAATFNTATWQTKYTICSPRAAIRVFIINLPKGKSIENLTSNCQDLLKSL